MTTRSNGAAKNRKGRQNNHQRTHRPGPSQTSDSACFASFAGSEPMAQLKKVVEPFGEVNVYPAAGGKVRVVATILMEPSREGTQTGIALDGSGSMQNLYG